MVFLHTSDQPRDGGGATAVPTERKRPLNTVTTEQTWHALIEKLATRRVEHRTETPFDESQRKYHVFGGDSPFVLQQALSFRTGHHL